MFSENNKALSQNFDFLLSELVKLCKILTYYLCFDVLIS